MILTFMGAWLCLYPNALILMFLCKRLERSLGAELFNKKTDKKSRTRGIFDVYSFTSIFSTWAIYMVW